MMVRVILSGVRVFVNVRVALLVAVPVGNLVEVIVEVSVSVLLGIGESVLVIVVVFEGSICMLGVGDTGSGVLLDTRVGVIVHVVVGVNVVVATQPLGHAVGINVANSCLGEVALNICMTTSAVTAEL